MHLDLDTLWLGHADILQEKKGAHKGGNAFSFFLFSLAFPNSYAKIPADARKGGCNLYAKAPAYSSTGASGLSTRLQ